MWYACRAAHTIFYSRSAVTNSGGQLFLLTCPLPTPVSDCPVALALCSPSCSAPLSRGTCRQRWHFGQKPIVVLSPRLHSHRLLNRSSLFLASPKHLKLQASLHGERPRVAPSFSEASCSLNQPVSSAKAAPHKARWPRQRQYSPALSPPRRIARRNRCGYRPRRDLFHHIKRPRAPFRPRLSPHSCV